ncbi:molybdopterin-dependent oxidoreductase [Gluconacetobacter azotocaptans]|uniref:molybdopterin-dependent oxidoreductase n=1 Tax=Gluconacetobacter azotocaptans TaxID=142834 RepID=UPI00195E9FF5|nr:molybdopterin-dependent oxidoreductase [Gluconacetobacter azotocaptans]MBM9400429.1 molybdopterin-dependent oxidoreductase [Gluconacetobacter azotocaptans]
MRPIAHWALVAALSLYAGTTGLSAHARADGLVVRDAAGAEHRLSMTDLAALPVVRVTMPPGKDHTAPRLFEGPLLWSVLSRAGVVGDPPRDLAARVILLEGTDRYHAALAVGEVAPDFEGKQVILAERMDGADLGPTHLRIVVPGDRRGAGGVHDLTRISIVAIPSGAAR